VLELREKVDENFLKKPDFFVSFWIGGKLSDSQNVLSGCLTGFTANELIDTEFRRRGRGGIMGCSVCCFLLVVFGGCSGSWIEVTLMAGTIRDVTFVTFDAETVFVGLLPKKGNNFI
jgi:hypothetical protein